MVPAYAKTWRPSLVMISVGTHVIDVVGAIFLFLNPRSGHCPKDEGDGS